MVGRDEPLAAARRRCSTSSAAGRGRVAFVVGEPGIGKSRLLAELQARSALDPATRRRGATWVEGRCVSYGRNLPYHLLIDLVRSILGITVRGGRGGGARRRSTARSRELLGADAAEVADTAPYLAHLLGLPLRPDEADRRTSLDPDVLQGRYVAATHRLLRGLAAERPARPRLRGPPLGGPGSIDGRAPAHAARHAAADPVRRGAARRDGLRRAGR